MKEPVMEAFGWPATQQQMNNWLRHLSKKYNFDGARWRALYQAQGGLCPGCKGLLAEPFTKNGKLGLKPQVDHWHDRSRPEPEFGAVCEAAEVRGLLCGPCNSWIGKMLDDVDRIKNLFEYLHNHEVKRGRR